MRILGTLAFALSCHFSASAAIWYVDKDAPAFGDGTSWATAYRTIQPAIDAAYDDGGGEVWISEGVYGEARISYPHGIEAGNTGSVVMKEGVSLYGGFAGSEVSRGQRDWEVREAIIDGSASRGGGSAYHVVVGASNATLDGVILINGRADGDWGATGYGGGMYNENASPTVINCSFSDNSANQGGGTYNDYNSSPTITNCSFSGNSANNGGGMYNEVASPTITNCSFSDNSANQGGGMYNNSASPTITNCSFSGNSASYGGGIQNYVNSSPAITNCSFIGNLGNLSGGIYNYYNSSPAITNCSFSGNPDNGAEMLNAGSSPAITNCSFSINSQVGAAIVNSENSSPTVLNCILWGYGTQGLQNFQASSTTVTHSLVLGGFVGEGNLDEDPIFVRNPAPGGDAQWGTDDDDYGDLRLQAGSPCINAGTLDGAPSLDMVGALRPQGSGVDMGAYERIGTPQFSLTVNSAGSGTVSPPVGVYPVQSGSIIPFNANPANNWRWAGWSGALNGLTIPQTLTVNGNRTVTATFMPLSGQGNITGVVTDWRSGLAIDAVSIVLFDNQFGSAYGNTTTNASGSFTLSAPLTLPMRLTFENDQYAPGERSGVVAPATLSVALEPLFPAAPSHVTALPGPGNVLVRWEPSSSPDVFGYFVFRGTNNDFGSSTLLTTSNPVTSTSYRDRSAGAGTFYYWVVALDEDEYQSVPAASEPATAGIVAVFIGEVSGNPGETVLVPITVTNATDLSPFGLDFNLRYSAGLVDPLVPIQVQKSSLLTGVGVQVNTNEAGRIRISATAPQGASALKGEGLLFHILLPLRSNAATGSCGAIYFDDFFNGTATQPGAVLYDKNLAPLPVSYSDQGRACIAGTASSEGEGEGACTIVASDRPVIYFGLPDESGDIPVVVRVPAGHQLVEYLVPTATITSDSEIAEIGIGGPTGWGLNSEQRIPFSGVDNLVLQTSLEPPEWATDHFRGNLFVVSTSNLVFYFALDEWNVYFGANDSIVIDDGFRKVDKGGTGSCCWDGGCGVYPPELCAALQGTYGGDGTTCGVTTCSEGEGQNEGEGTAGGTVIDFFLQDYIAGCPPVDGNCIAPQGDLSGDGLVTSADSVKALRVAVGLADAGTDCELQAGDINGDGVIDAADAILISRLAVGLPLNPPAVKSNLEEKAGPYVVTVSTLEAESGSTVDVPVTVSNATAIAGAELGVGYPPGLVFVSAATGTLTAGFNLEAHAENGYLRVALSDSTALISGSGSLVTLRFSIAAGTPEGTVLPLALSLVSLKGQYGERAEWLSTVNKVSGNITVSDGTGEGSVDGEGNVEGEGNAEGEGASEVYHSADQNADGKIVLSELLRVIQLYNSTGYGCDQSGEDDFAPNSTDQTCAPHDGDYDPLNWRIDFSELLRIVQFYNAPAYHSCPGSEDDFCSDSI